MKFKQKLHKYYECNTANAQVVVVNPKIFLVLPTAFVIIFMNFPVVSVNATAILATTDNVGALAATMARTPLHQNATRNATDDQQSPKTESPQIQLPPAASSSSAIPMPSIGWSTTSLSSSSSVSASSSLSVARQTNNEDNILHSNNIRFPYESIDNCKSLTGTWSDVDPNIFYVCDMQTKKPLTMHCPEGRGYINGRGHSGCIPYDRWPACVASSTLHSQVLICDSDHMQQPWESLNPNKFYICLQEATEPILLDCGPGKGFVHATIAPGAAATPPVAGEIVGCANWEKWRSYMKCTDYY